MSLRTDFRKRIYASYVSVSEFNQFLQSKYDAHAHNIGPHLRGAQRGGGRLLDIGPGQGELLTLCRDGGVEAEGVDVSQELVAACRARGLSVRPIDDLMAALGAEKNEWSVVTMIDVLEHFSAEEALQLLDLVRSHALSPGGRLIVQVPNMASPFAASNLYHDVTHTRGYTDHSMVQLLRNAGFREVRVFPQNYPPHGLQLLRQALRAVFYLCLRVVLIIDQPNRSAILTPNLIAVADL